MGMGVGVGMGMGIQNVRSRDYIPNIALFRSWACGRGQRRWHVAKGWESSGVSIGM
jgi:hypothetical protein